MKLIYFFIAFILVSGCSSNRIINDDQKIIPSLTAEISHDQETYSIVVYNHSKDTLRVGTTFGAGGFYGIVSDESGNIVYDPRPRRFDHFTYNLMPFESFIFTEKASIGEFLAMSAKVRESGNYTITVLNEEYNIHESFTVYFDYEKYMKRLGKR